MKLAMPLVVAAAVGGCAGSTPSLKLSKTQRDALQVRDVEASPDRAFAAATNAVLDSGFTVEVTDGEGGLLTAVRREDPSVAEHTAVLTLSTVLSMGQAPMLAPSRLYGLGIQVLPRPGGLSSVRIQPYGSGSLEADRREISELWALMQRQVLIKEPPGKSAREPGPGKRGSPAAGLGVPGPTVAAHARTLLWRASHRS